MEYIERSLCCTLFAPLRDLALVLSYVKLSCLTFLCLYDNRTVVMFYDIKKKASVNYTHYDSLYVVL